MNEKTWLEKQLDKNKNDFDFKKEKLILKITESICQSMAEQKLSKAELAKKTKTSRAYITKVLSGDNNYTLKTLLQIAEALNSEIEFIFKHKLFKQISSFDLPGQYDIYKEKDQYEPIKVKYSERREELYV
jgi:transcriptional regulator with XRE-family HTH domain